MAPHVSPTARALLTLELLQNNPGITAAALADRLGISDRAVRRYVEILREADIPVEAIRGPAGGYRLGRGMRLPPLVFSATEALGLAMAVLDGHHDVRDTAQPAASAIAKILRALPKSVAAQADAVVRSAAPLPDRGAARPDPAVTASLVQAIADRRRISVGYRPESGKTRSYDIEPWAVVIRHSRWYLLCGMLPDHQTRALRIDRVGAVDVLAETFEPPPSLDPGAALEAHLAAGWDFECTVTIDATRDRVAPFVSRALGRLTALDDRTTQLTGTTADPAWYAEELARIPAAFHVNAGPELKACVRRLGRRLLDAAEPPS